MSTIKISQLTNLNTLNSNTSNTLFVGVDIPTSVTAKFTATTLANGLYLNNNLIVGNNSILFPYTIAQFSGNSSSYLQTNFQNFNSAGSGDVIITADTGTDSNSFIDIGINNSQFSDASYSSMNAYDGYLYINAPSTGSHSGNLVVGTTSSNANISFIVGGTLSQNVVGGFSSSGLYVSSDKTITFGDSTHQSTAAAPSSYTQAAFDRANTVNTTIMSYVSGVDATQNTTILAAYNSANSAGVLAQAAFNEANSAFDHSNTTITLAQTAFNSSNTVNAYSYSTNTFLQQYVLDNVQLQSNVVTLLAQSAFNTANSATVLAQSAFNRANTAIGDFNVLSSEVTSIQTVALNANTLATNAVANTSNITLPGALSVSGLVSVNDSTFSSNTALVKLTASNNFATVAPINAGYMLQITGQDNTPTRVILDSFGANTYGLLAGRTGRGTATAPQNTANNDVLLRLSGNGYANSGFSSAGVGRIDIVASENYTDATKGSQIKFWNTRQQTNTLINIATFNADSVEFSGVVNPQKGFVYSPNVISGSTSSLSIDIANTSLIKCNSSSGLTVSLSHFQVGKVVEVWFINSSGSTQSITHGCLANNSTVGATSFNIPGSSCANLKYFSIDGDLANTFVSIQHP